MSPTRSSLNLQNLFHFVKYFNPPPKKTSLSVCQVARATGEAKCHGSKLHKEVTEIKVYWFVCLNTFKFAKSKNGLFETGYIYM